MILVLAVATITIACLMMPAVHSASTIPRACVPPHDTYPFCNPKLSMSARVDDLISRHKLEEKPYLLTARESPKGNISRLGIPEYDWVRQDSSTFLPD